MLNLSNRSLTPDDFEQMRNYQIIDVSFTDITDDQLHYLQHATEVNLSNTNVTKCLVNVKVLNIYKTKISFVDDFQGEVLIATQPTAKNQHLFYRAILIKYPSGLTNQSLSDLHDRGVKVY